MKMKRKRKKKFKPELPRIASNFPG